MNKKNMKKEVCKVILVGEQGVGKTSIIKRFLKDDFNEEESSTVGANFASKELTFNEYNKSLQYDIWDTAGQEQYRAFTKIFYQDSSIALIVYDITDRKSFEEVKSFWSEQIKENCSKNISKKN